MGGLTSLQNQIAEPGRSGVSMNPLRYFWELKHVSRVNMLYASRADTFTHEIVWIREPFAPRYSLL